MAFKTGDIVQLKSGSPVLTVVAVEDSSVDVVWYAEEVGQFRSHTLPASTLDEVEFEDFDVEDDEDEDEEEAGDADREKN
ncbi:MAG: hypothetical protein B7Z15_12230 [Rhizobiales bacterium 32-66-8]|nr:MAG: hypothetical protein B7Z15_12230 [Rhizobiales bacterium 32-66-8]